MVLIGAPLGNSWPLNWAWAARVEIMPPGYGPQVLVHVSTYQGKPFWGYHIFEPLSAGHLPILSQPLRRKSSRPRFPVAPHRSESKALVFKPTAFVFQGGWNHRGSWWSFASGMHLVVQKGEALLGVGAAYENQPTQLWW